ncbi:MAG: hypothetical protein JWN48_3493 [Myxococcaceae bacterium]|nr:hypothetical protein [Myxococcaceae bacterium]
MTTNVTNPGARSALEGEEADGVRVLTRGSVALHAPLAQRARGCDAVLDMFALLRCWLLACLFGPLATAHADESSTAPLTPVFPAAAGPRAAPAARSEAALASNDEPGWLWRRSQGALVLSLAGELAFVASGAITGEPKVVGGVEGQLLGALRGWPLLVGLGAGSVVLERARRAEYGPWGWQRDEDSLLPQYGRSSTITRHSLQLRHVELVARFQPYWGVVRPYLESFVGVGSLWQGTKVNSELVEKTRSAAVLYGATLGLDWQLFPQALLNEHFVVLTLAFKRLHTGQLTRKASVASEADRTIPAAGLHVRDSLALWTPMLALGIAL